MSQCTNWAEIREYHYEWRMGVTGVTQSEKVSIFALEIFLFQIKIFFLTQSWQRRQRRESWWAWLSDWGLAGLGPLWVRSPFHPSAHGWLSLTGMTISPPNHQPVRYTQSNALHNLITERNIYDQILSNCFNDGKLIHFLPSVSQKSFTRFKVKFCNSMSECQMSVSHTLGMGRKTLHADLRFVQIRPPGT